MMKKINYFGIVFLIGIFLFSCNRDKTHMLYLSSNQNENLITKKSATNIAQNLVFENTAKKNSNKISQHQSALNLKKKEVLSTFTVPDINNKPAYFIINYKNGGFVILAADKRSRPILAFSETSHFDLDSKYFPSGLVGWLYASKEKIEKIRKDNIKITKGIKQQWDNLSNGKGNVFSNMVAPNGGDCNPYTVKKGPLLQTTWDQGSGYNSQTPMLSCNDYLPDGHAWTGCVATAMAQVMKYYKYPTNYNWSAMPNNYGTEVTAKLMRDIGNSVNMNYQCDGSGALENKLAPSFINNFSYSTASYSGYNYQTVINELNQSRPVILSGGKKTGWWIFGQYSGGHAWVCDGYIEYYSCYSTTLSLHMNWGWGGLYNAWYSFDNFNPGSNTFNYKREMVYNIKP